MSVEILSMLSQEELQTVLDDRLFRSILDTMTHGVLVLNAIRNKKNEIKDFVFAFANATAENYFGKKMAGINLSSILTGANKDLFFPKFMEVITTGAKNDFIQNDTKEGLMRWFHYAFNKVGKGIMVTQENITEQKKAEEEIRQKNQLIEQWVESPPDAAKGQEDRQDQRMAFLAGLTDGVHPLEDPVEVQAMLINTAMRYFKADRCYYCEIDGDTMAIRRDAFHAALPSIANVYSLGDMPLFKTSLQSGNSIIVRETGTSERMDDKFSRMCETFSIAAYINVPVIKKGQLVGNFCVTQSRPREWTGAEVKLAIRLAEHTWALVERRRAEEALHECQQRLALCLKAAKIGVFEWSSEGRSVQLSEGSFDVLGLIPANPLLAFDEMHKLVHPEDVQHHQEIFERAARMGEDYYNEFRIMRPKDGKVAWIAEQGHIMKDAKENTIIRGLHRDITQIKVAEGALRKSEARLSAILKSLPVGVAVAEVISGKIVLSNKEMNRFMPTGSIRSQDDDSLWRWKAFYPDGSPVEPQNYPDARGLRGETVLPGLEMLYTGDDGSEIWTRVAWVPIHDHKGAIMEEVAVVSDISELKRTAKSSRESEAGFHGPANLGAIGMAITSPTKGVLKVNDEICNILGYDRNALMKMSWAEMTHPDDTAADTANFNRMMAGVIEDYTIEKRWIRKDGQIIDTAVSINAIRNTGGAVDYFVTLLEVITEGKKAEITLHERQEEQLSQFNVSLGQQISDRTRELKEQSLFISQITDTVPDMISIMELSSRKMNYINKETFVAHGFDPDVMSKLSPEELREMTHPEDHKALENYYNRFRKARDNQIVTAEYRAKNLLGKWLWFKLRGVVFQRDDSGNVTHILNISQNITEQKNAEEKNDELNKSLLAKNRELQSVNSELRTFTSLAASDYKETLKHLYTLFEFIITTDARNLSNTGKANIRRAQSSIQKMKLLTDDIIAFSGIQSASDLQTVNLFEVCNAAIQKLERKIEDTQAKINFPDKLKNVKGYPDLLLLLFYHLLDNAIKFRNENADPIINIRISHVAGMHINHADADPKTTYIVLAVTDNGVGISPFEREKIFGMFYKAHDKKYKGSGIGLAICKKIMDIHNGFIMTEPTPENRGMTFSCFFPLQKNGS